MKMLGFFLLVALVANTYQAALPSNVVEVYFVVDKQAANRYVHTSSAADPEADAAAQIKADVDYFVTELNQMYATLAENGLSLEVRIRKLDILDTDVFPGPNVKTSDGLTKFDDWLKAQGSSDALKFDHAMLWTGHNIQGSSGSDAVSGFAHVAAICDPAYSTSIVEHDGTYQTILVSAHELGHSLGSSHDATSDGHIMASANDIFAGNRGLFSAASAKAILENIGKLTTNCLTDTNPESTAPSASVTTVLGDPDLLCIRFQNRKDSYMAKGAFYYNNALPQGDKVCQAIQCTFPGSNGIVYSAYTSNGIVCGENQKCGGGKCVASPDPVSFDANCPYGDEKYIDYSATSLNFKGACADLIARDGKGICQKSYIEAACCESCAKVQTGIEGCKYGDKNKMCVNYGKEVICPSNAALCCEHCNGFTAKRDATSNSDLFLIEPNNTPNDME